MKAQLLFTTSLVAVSLLAIEPALARSAVPRQNDRQVTATAELPPVPGPKRRITVGKIDAIPRLDWSLHGRRGRPRRCSNADNCAEYAIAVTAADFTLAIAVQNIVWGLSQAPVGAIADRFGLQDAIYTRTLHTVGIPESDLDARIEPLFRRLENPKIAVLAHDFRVDVKIMAKASDRAAADDLIAPVEAELRQRIGRGIFGVDDERFEDALVRVLTQRGLTIATAESVTGGGISDTLVRVPGASKVFRGGIIAYDDALKTSLLGVEETLLRAHGAVSAEVAEAMARGVRARLDANLSIASTGIAGPSGASAEKPLGLVFLAIAHDDGVEVRRITFPGSRDDVRRRSIIAALNLLWRLLAKEETRPVPPT